MGILVAKRYELIASSPSAKGFEFENWIAQDLQSGTNSTVNLCILKKEKQNSLVHQTFLHRAKEFSTLSNKQLARLVDYGFDESFPGYYIVYGRTLGQQLSTRLGSAPEPPFAWCVDLLLELCGALFYLQTHGAAHGNLFPENILLDINGGLPLEVHEWGLHSLYNLLEIEDLGPDDDLLRESVRDDTKALGQIAAQLITNTVDFKHAATRAALEDLPRPFQIFIDRCLGRKNPYSSIAEAQLDLRRALAEYQTKTIYYLLSTKKAAERLFEMGFIDKPEGYMVVDLLDDELKGEVYGRPNPGPQDTVYYVTTARFRLRCVPDRQAPERNPTVSI
jgi:serine/threonine protein kinase